MQFACKFLKVDVCFHRAPLLPAQCGSLQAAWCAASAWPAVCPSACWHHALSAPCSCFRFPFIFPGFGGNVQRSVTLLPSAFYRPCSVRALCGSPTVGLPHAAPQRGLQPSCLRPSRCGSKAGRGLFCPAHVTRGRVLHGAWGAAAGGAPPWCAAQRSSRRRGGPSHATSIAAASSL